MIIHQFGNVLDVEEGIIVHGCNAQGVMGSGVALQVKQRFPEAYDEYKKRHSYGGLWLNSISVYEVSKSKYIVNAITQDNYGNVPNYKYVSYDAIESCFRKVVDYFSNKDIKTICFPMIGAGLGGGDWKIISTIIDETVPDTYTKILYTL